MTPLPRDDRSAAPLSPPWLRLALPLSWLYALVVTLRATLYRRGIFRTRRLDVPVVSVGNLAAGGTGKTPVVEHLARTAARAGLRPVVISRGYGRKGRSHLIRVRGSDGAVANTVADATTMGDEPLWLAARNPQIPVYIGANRHAAGRFAEAVDAPGLVLLDDAYQHLAIARDLNLLLVDAELGLCGGRVLPAGLLREPRSAIGRADAVAITKANHGDPGSLAAQLDEYLSPGTPVFRFEYVADRLIRLDRQEERSPQELAGRRVSLICAIARPQGFVVSVEALGAGVDRVWVRPDHDPYAPSTIDEIDQMMGSPHASEMAWLTTEKDAVKLRERLPAPERLWVLAMAVRPDAEWETFFGEFIRRTVSDN